MTFSGKTIVDDKTENIRITWKSKGKNTASYRIYREDAGQLQFEGETANTSYTLLNQERAADTAVYHVVPVDQHGRENQGKATKAVYTFETLKRPEITINANKTLVSVGEPVTLTATVSKSTESIDWEIIGGNPQNISGQDVTVTFDEAGSYTVKATARNSAGETELIQEEYIYVYDQTSGIVSQNLSLLPTTTATEGSGYTNDGESYRFALDGDLSTKWCDNSSDKPWMIVDLGSVKTIAGFELFHAGAGGESAEWNTQEYDISVSEDGKNWTTVVQKRGNKVTLAKMLFVSLKLVMLN
ncbi:discoidin domain-containing protein [Enterococcus termitis]